MPNTPLFDDCKNPCCSGGELYFKNYQKVKCGYCSLIAKVYQSEKRLFTLPKQAGNDKMLVTFIINGLPEDHFFDLNKNNEKRLYYSILKAMGIEGGE